MVRLSPLMEAYASVRVAVFEPIFVQWTTAPEKDSNAPGLVEATVSGQEDPEDRVWRYRFRVTGSARVVSLTYTLHFEPSADVLKTWNEQVIAAQQAWEAEQQEAAFDRAKRVIVAKTQVRPRPAADLRDEERYELLNRMISEAFHDAPAVPPTREASAAAYPVIDEFDVVVPTEGFIYQAIETD